MQSVCYTNLGMVWMEKKTQQTKMHFWGMFHVQVSERKCRSFNLRVFAFFFWGYLRRNTRLVRGHLQ